jgi:hypothetical protein
MAAARISGKPAPLMKAKPALARLDLRKPGDYLRRRILGMGGSCQQLKLRNTQDIDPRWSDLPDRCVSHPLLWRTLTVMLSREALIDTASKPSFGAIAIIHPRVRTAVLPACSIWAPQRSNTSSASGSGRQPSHRPLLK